MVGPRVRSRLLLVAAAFACFQSIAAVPHDGAQSGIQRIEYTVTDPQRDNRLVAALVLTPEGPPIENACVAFAHGFGITPEYYLWIAERLVERRGYTVALPREGGVLPSTRNLARDQRFLCETLVDASVERPDAPFYGRVANLTVLSGQQVRPSLCLLPSLLASAEAG